MTTSVSIDNVSKEFSGTTAVDSVSIEIGKGEFFTLLGSSGCGKTTLLRIIAGFLPQTRGDIRFGDKIINNVPAHQRNTGMVFQNYAIFPHLSVFENVAYGLKVRGRSRGDIDREVRQMLELVRLGHLSHRLPRELSGGQQQRVVLARAMVIKPDVLLMDEPLSNLDTEMRLHLRSEIRALQQQFGVTTIYVTHDQEEALLISDRVAVMSAGKVVQLGPPREIYLQPSTLFVASFIGDNNLLPAIVEETRPDGSLLARLPGGQALIAHAAPGQKLSHGEACTVSLRPQDVDLKEGGSGGLEGVLEDIQFLGNTIKMYFSLGEGKPVVVTLPGRHDVTIPTVGSKCTLHPSAHAVTAFEGVVSQ